MPRSAGRRQFGGDVSRRPVDAADRQFVPNRTQFESVVGERVQYAAARCRFSKRGVSCALDDVSIGPKAIFELRAEMVSQGELGCAVGAILSSNSRGSQFCGYGKTERYVRVKLMTSVPMAAALTS